MADLDTLYLIQKNSNGTKVEVPATTANFLVGVSGSVNLGSASTVGPAFGWSGPGGSILGGYGHCVSGGYSSVVQGYFNKISANSSTIAGGGFNIVSGNTNDSSIGGGRQNAILESSCTAVIAGGYANQIRKSSSSTVAGGMNNMISGENGGLNQDFNFIGGGYGNILKNKNGWSLIVGGLSNNICGSTNNEAFYNTIVGGWANSIVDTINTESAGAIGRSTILGGQSNTITGRGSYSQILGGYQNKISTDYSVVLGGICNKTDNCLGAFGSNSQLNLIYGMNNATVGGSNVILGGFQNTGSNGAFIVGGSHNIASPLGYIYQNASIINGSFNTTSGADSFIAGGSYNSITSNGNNATILGSYASINHEGAMILADSQNRNKLSSGSNTLTIDFSGGVYFSNRPKVNGTQVLLSGEAVQIDLSTTVRITGNQNVSGAKNFASRPTVNNTGVLLFGEASPSPIAIFNNGSSQGNASSLNFAGAGISVSTVGAQATIIAVGSSTQTTTIPTSSNSAGVSGSFSFDKNYLYYCTENNKWIRTALSIW